MKVPRNVFESIQDSGKEIDFEPMPVAIPCPWPKKSWGQLQTLRERAERGEELFHVDDNNEEASHEEHVHANKMINLAREEDERVKPTPPALAERYCSICGKRLRLYAPSKTCGTLCSIESMRRARLEGRRLRRKKKHNLT
jgi:hypothetical protein